MSDLLKSWLTEEVGLQLQNVEQVRLATCKRFALLGRNV